MKRFGDAIMVVVLLAAASLAALGWLYLTVGEGSTVAGRIVGGDDAGLWRAARWAVLLGGTMICLIGIRSILAGENGVQPPDAPRFGRSGRLAVVRPSPLRPVHAAVAATMIAAIGVDYMLSAPAPEFAEEIEAAAPAGEAAPLPSEPTPPEAAAPPARESAPPAAGIAEPAVPSSPAEVATLPPLPPMLTEPPNVEPPGPEPQTVSRTTAPMPPEPAPQPASPSGHTDTIDFLAVSPDGRTFMTASIDFTIKLWNFETRKLIRDVGRHKDMARAALYLPDGATALTAGDDGEIVLRTIADATALHVFSAAEHGAARGLAVDRDGRIAVSAHESGNVIVWDLEKRAVRHVLTGHSWSANGVAISPDGTQALTGSIDGEMRLWNLETGELLRVGLAHQRGIYDAAFTPDGRRIVTGSGDHTIRLWDVESGRELRVYAGHSGTVYTIELSADGKTILSTSLDGTVRLWDLESGDEKEQFIGHYGPVYAAAFGPEGTVITAGRDRTIRIWPARRGDEVAVIRGR